MAVAPANILTYNQSLSQGPTAAKAAASYIQKNAPAPSGTFNAHTTSAPVSTGGGTSSSASGGGVSSNNQPSYQSAPGAPDTSEIDAAYNDAMSGIDKLIGSYTDALPGQLAAFDTSAASDKTTTANQLADANAAYDTQAQNNQTDTQNTNNTQRNSVDEVLQGIQARFGGGTGTGAFAAEQAYRYGLQNIASNNQALQKVMAGIAQGKAQAQRDFVAQNAKIDANTANLKQQAKDQLNQQLASLQSTKGQLGINRATTKAQIMSSYQDTVNQINANNTQIKNQWAASQAQFEQQLQLKAQAVQDAALNHNNLTASQLISMVNAGTITPQYANAALKLPDGSIQAPKNNTAAAVSAAINTPIDQSSAQQNFASPTPAKNNVLQDISSFFGL